MLPRECDNDDCDYETYDDNGVGRARWVHVEGCDGLPEFMMPDPETVRPGSFLAYLMNSPTAKRG